MVTAVIAAGASIVVAVLTYALTQRGAIRQERRQARLLRVSSQLADLYGPLRALMETNEQTWEALRESHLPPRVERRFDAADPEWRRWRDLVLMPANRAMRDLILEHADLLLESELPEPLRQFCAHVAAFEVVLAAEADGIVLPTLVRHPGEAYVRQVREAFDLLTAERRRLLAS
ncbi:hypothetical protein IU433_20360 [Nocardia puris]|uniref:DUF4760 domain-containing protein n=1 Tax=Nocardia puris TaxID=208602 RepID=A0A366E254_9NOCA|nr:hypothetical protein [Nocardia puris]MBF6212799.1 hypothetical protein [Nocardia puris]MBF6367735.1 hypothetical protein [Nocardia puris]MBF6461386.1 hypothetical protein [Nocardia puris]RBO96377.1 hypothetical protein DFR74_101392 [Nocardia puris]